MFLCAEFMLKLTNGMIAGTAILRYEVYFEISICHGNADTKSVQRWSDLSMYIHSYLIRWFRPRTTNGSSRIIRSLIRCSSSIRKCPIRNSSVQKKLKIRRLIRVKIRKDKGLATALRNCLLSNALRLFLTLSMFEQTFSFAGISSRKMTFIVFSHRLKKRKE